FLDDEILSVERVWLRTLSHHFDQSQGICRQSCEYGVSIRIQTRPAFRVQRLDANLQRRREAPRRAWSEGRSFGMEFDGRWSPKILSVEHPPCGTPMSDGAEELRQQP